MKQNTMSERATHAVTLRSPSSCISAASPQSSPVSALAERPPGPLPLPNTCKETTISRILKFRSVIWHLLVLNNGQVLLELIKLLILLDNHTDNILFVVFSLACCHSSYWILFYFFVQILCIIGHNCMQLYSPLPVLKVNGMTSIIGLKG